jgi:hypothetical protein
MLSCVAPASPPPPLPVQIAKVEEKNTTFLSPSPCALSLSLLLNEFLDSLKSEKGGEERNEFTEIKRERERLLVKKEKVFMMNFLLFLAYQCEFSLSMNFCGMTL